MDVFAQLNLLITLDYSRFTRYIEFLLPDIHKQIYIIENFVK